MYIYIYTFTFRSFNFLYKNAFFFFATNVNTAFFGIRLLQKNYFNLKKIFVPRLSKMATNQTECSRLKQMSVIRHITINHNFFKKLHLCFLLPNSFDKIHLIY